MQVKGEIIDFISAAENNGALLVTGEWGCGKSYLVKQIADEINDKDEFHVAIISLFGVQNVAQLNHCVKEAYLDANTGFWGKTVRKVGRIVAETAKEGTDVAATVTSYLVESPASAVLSGTSKGISALMSINPFDLIPVKNTIDRDNKKFVLVFDDFERCNIDVIDLLGAINEYCENRKIKTLIICDETHIESKKYGEFKEKLISRTLHLQPDYNSIINSIVNSYKETTEGYKTFLSDNISLITQVFFESKHENLRTLKSLIFDFERIYTVWSQNDVPTEQMPLVLYAFGVILFEYKAGNYNKSDKYGYIFAETQYKDKYSKLILAYQFKSLQQWIVEGIWDETLFIGDIRKLFSPEPLTYYHLFLNDDFWDLDDEIISKGLSDALDIGYRGGLTCQEFINLFGRIYNFQKFGATLPVTVDYNRLREGIKIREDAIENGEIEEPDNISFITPDIVKEFTEDAKALYMHVEFIANRKEAWRNRLDFVRFLMEPKSYNTASLRGVAIVSFDEELMDIFVVSFQKACNRDKRVIYRVLSKLCWDYSSISTKDDIQNSINNFQTLVSRLEEMEKLEQDSISKVIIRETAKNIPDIIAGLSINL